MIWHFFEVWLLLMAAFAIGCGLGSSLYSGLARGPLALAQGAVADAVGDAVDAIKWRLGVGPDWRPSFQPPAERPVARAPKSDSGSENQRPIAAAPPSWADEAQPEGEEWPDDPDWEEGRAEETTDEPGGAAKFAAGDGPSAIATLPEDNTMMRPAGLSAPRAGVPDNLQRIRGVGKRNEELLYGLGIFHFGQIAAWTPAEARWVGAHIAFPERIERDDWIGQAIILASGGATDYVKAVAERQKAAEEKAEQREEEARGSEANNE
jgi:predicted flap endonuclease-1-like 5' DNA nuclease